MDCAKWRSKINRSSAQTMRSVFSKCRPKTVAGANVSLPLYSVAIYSALDLEHFNSIELDSKMDSCVLVRRHNFIKIQFSFSHTPGSSDCLCSSQLNAIMRLAFVVSLNISATVDVLLVMLAHMPIDSHIFFSFFLYK